MANFAQRLLRTLAEDDKPRRDVGKIEVKIQRVRRFDGSDWYIATCMVPTPSGNVKLGEETKECRTVGSAIEELKRILKDVRRVTGTLSIAGTYDKKTQFGIDHYKRSLR